LTKTNQIRITTCLPSKKQGQIKLNKKYQTKVNNNIKIEIITIINAIVTLKQSKILKILKTDILSNFPTLKVSELLLTKKNISKNII